MKCTKCGFENDSNAKFCKECGNPVTPPAKKGNDTKSKKPIKNVIIPIIIIIAIIIAFGISIIVVGSSYSADNVAKQYAKAMFSVDIDSIYKYSNIEDIDISKTINKKDVEEAYESIYKDSKFVDVSSDYSEALKKYNEETNAIEKMLLKPNENEKNAYTATFISADGNEDKVFFKVILSDKKHMLFFDKYYVDLSNYIETSRFIAPKGTTVTLYENTIEPNCETIDDFAENNNEIRDFGDKAENVDRYTITYFGMSDPPNIEVSLPGIDEKITTQLGNSLNDIISNDEGSNGEYKLILSNELMVEYPEAILKSFATSKTNDFSKYEFPKGINVLDSAKEYSDDWTKKNQYRDEFEDIKDMLDFKFKKVSDSYICKYYIDTNGDFYIEVAVDYEYSYKFSEYADSPWDETESLNFLYKFTNNQWYLCSNIELTYEGE